MLEINPENVCFIIDKAHEFHAKEDVVIPEISDSPADDWALQVLANHSDDKTYAEVSSVIRDLEPDQKATLVALMWLGRGDYGLDEWENAVQVARDLAADRIAEHLLATPLVADYLAEGLAMHGYSCEE